MRNNQLCPAPSSCAVISSSSGIGSYTRSSPLALNPVPAAVPGQRVWPNLYGRLRLPEGGYGMDMSGRWFVRPPEANTMPINGTPVTADVDFFSNEANPDLGIAPKEFPGAFIDESYPDYVIGYVSTVQQEMRLFYAPSVQMKADKVKWSVLAKPTDNLVRGLAFYKDQVYAVTHAGAPRYRLIRTSVTHPDWARAETVIPEAGDSIQYIAKSKSFLFVVYSDGITGRVTASVKTVSVLQAPTTQNLFAQYMKVPAEMIQSGSVLLVPDSVSTGNDNHTFRADASICKNCHYSGNSVGALLKGSSAIANLSFHVNGRTDIGFPTTPLKIVSKAQLRTSSFNIYSGLWVRNGGNYKNGVNAYDTAKVALSNSMWTAGTPGQGTCANISCHNLRAGQTVKWNEVVTCLTCHSNL